jgi:GntR family transcriptional regulator
VPDRPAELPSKHVADSMRQRIEAGEWQPGQQLPPVRQLAEHYGVARRTVTRAMKALEDEGLVRVTPGWGTHRTGGG